MNKRIKSFGVAAGVFLATGIVVYAVTTLFFTKSVTSKLNKKTIFQFDLSTELSDSEVGPGDSFALHPVVKNDATEEMYVFIKIQMPEYDGEPLYIMDADGSWMLVESTGDSVVYAYGNPEMIILYPGESTSALTDRMTMRSISNADYAAIDDINITITGYSIGTEGVDSVPGEAWSACKQIGGLE